MKKLQSLTKRSRKLMKMMTMIQIYIEDEKSLSLHYSDTEEECPSPKIPKIVLSEAEKRHERNIQEREKLWEQQEDEQSKFILMPIFVETEFTL